MPMRAMSSAASFSAFSRLSVLIISAASPISAEAAESLAKREGMNKEKAFKARKLTNNLTSRILHGELQLLRASVGSGDFFPQLLLQVGGRLGERIKGPDGVLAVGVDFCDLFIVNSPNVIKAFLVLLAVLFKSPVNFVFMYPAVASDSYLL